MRSIVTTVSAAWRRFAGHRETFLSIAISLSIAIFLLGTSCLKLDVSPLDSSRGEAAGWIGTLFQDLVRSDSCGGTFYAYSNGALFYKYSACQPLTSVPVTGITGFRSVAKTASGFVAVDGTTNNVWFSSDSIDWTSVATFTNGTASVAGARVAACGNNVVVAYPFATSIVAVVNNVNTLYSAKGGSSFAAGAQVDASSTSIGDLVCDSGVFHISTGTSPYYKYSSNPAGGWSSPTTGPTYTLIYSGLGAHGSTILGYQFVTSATLARSTDGGSNWNSAGPTAQGYPLAMAYANVYFYAPYIGSSNSCVMHRSMDGLTWDDSAADPCPTPSYGRAIYDVAGSGNTVMAVGYNNISAVASVPVFMILLTTDGGNSWSAPLTSGSGYMYAVVAF